MGDTPTDEELQTFLEDVAGCLRGERRDLNPQWLASRLSMFSLVIKIQDCLREAKHTQNLLSIIKEMNEHEGAEGWSADLRKRIAEVLPKTAVRPPIVVASKKVIREHILAKSRQIKGKS